MEQETGNSQQQNINQPTASQPPKLSPHHRVHTLVGIAIVALIAAGAAYFVWTKIPKICCTVTPQPQQATENQTVGWQTYRNEKYGFEMLMPITEDDFVPHEQSNRVSFIRSGEAPSISILISQLS